MQILNPLHAAWIKYDGSQLDDRKQSRAISHTDGLILRFGGTDLRVWWRGEEMQLLLLPMLVLVLGVINTLETGQLIQMQFYNIAAAAASNKNQKIFKEK